MSKRTTFRAGALSNPAAERGLLACFLRRPDDVALVSARDLFTEPRHGAIFDAICDLHATDGRGVDVWAVVERLPEYRDYLLDLVDEEKNPAAVTPTPLVRILQGCAALRHFDSVAKVLQARIADGDSPDEIAAFLRSQSTQDGGCSPPPRFRLISAEEMLTVPALERLAGELLAVDSLVVWFGAPGTGKSFLALDLALSIATGVPCLGNTVRQGPVVYIAAEGVGGLGIRVRAWKQAHDHAADQPLGVSFVTEAVNLRQKDDVDALIAVLKTLPERPVLLVVDTFARCLVGGEENSAKDVGLAIAALDRVRRTVGCAVLVVHHTGKNAEIERGSSALRAAADTMLAITKDGDAITLHCEKQKNAAPFKDIGLRLVPIDLGDGESSCVLELGEPKPEDLSGSKGKALRALIELFDEDGATVTDWQRNSRIPETTFRRARKALERADYVSNPPETRGGLVNVTAAGRAAAERLAATGSGGKARLPNQRSSPDRHSPPPPRHGGDRPSPPPPPPPYKGGGAAVDGGGEDLDDKEVLDL